MKRTGERMRRMGNRAAQFRLTDANGGGRVRHAAFLLSALAAVYFGFFTFSTETAVRLVRYSGYWILLAAVLCFLFAVFRVCREREVFRKGRFRRLGAALLFVLVLGVVQWGLQPTGYKIVADEPVLGATAAQMHREREVFYPSRTYELEGKIEVLDGYVDKRRALFPFLVSLLHDFTGFRGNQSFLLNAALTPLFFGLVFFCGHKIWPRWGGWAGCALLATVPLVPMIANSGGVELLNAVLLLGVAATGLAYLKRPGRDNLDVLLLTCVLLAHTRYESALFVFSVAGIVVCGWWRVGYPVLSWMAVLVPLLLLPLPWQQQVFEANPVLWQLDHHEVAAPFAPQWIPRNLKDAADYFFYSGDRLPNSLLLSVGFVAALVVLAVRLLRGGGRRGPLPVEAWGWIGVGGGILAGFLLLMSYHWGQLDDVGASRLILPFLLLQAGFVLWAASSFSSPRLPALTLLLLCGLFFWGKTRPMCAGSDFLFGADLTDLSQWAGALADEHQEGNPLFITDGVAAMAAAGVSAIPEKWAAAHKAEVEFHRRLGTFNGIYGLYRVRPVPGRPGEKRSVSPLDRDFVLEPLRDKKISDESSLRLSRLRGVRREETERAGNRLESVPEERAGELTHKQFLETLP